MVSKQSFRFSFLLCFLVISFFSCYELVKAQDIPSSFIEKYFDGDDELAEKFIENEKKIGIFLPSEWEKNAVKFQRIRSAREAILTNLSKRYFNDKREDLDAWITEELDTKKDEDGKIIDQDDDYVEYLDSISVSDLEVDLTEKISEFQSKDEFQQIVLSTYFSDNEQEYLKFREEMEEQNITDQKVILEILKIEEKNKTKIEFLADTYFDGEIFITREFIRKANRNGITSYVAWKKLAEKESRENKILQGNLKNMALVYFGGNEEKLEQYIEDEKEKGEGHDTFADWDSSLKADKNKLDEEQRIWDLFKRKYFFDDEEKTARFFKLQDEENLANEYILRDEVSDFLKTENNEAYQDMVKTHNDALEKFVEEQYFPVFSYRTLSDEQEAERKENLKLFLEDQEKMTEARNKQKAYLLEQQEDSILEDKKLFIEEQSTILFVVDKKREEINNQNQERIDLAEGKTAEGERAQVYKKIDMKTAIVENNYNDFIESSGGLLNGREVSKKDFRYFVGLEKAVSSSDDRNILRYQKKLEKFSISGLTDREELKARNFLLKGDQKNFLAQLPISLSKKISVENVHIIRSLLTDYENKDIDSIIAKRKLLPLDDSQWAIIRELVSK